MGWPAASSSLRSLSCSSTYRACSVSSPASAVASVSVVWKPAAASAAAMAAALAAVGFHTTDTLATALAGELTEHARHVELQDSERSELEAAGQPIYELPMIAEGIDLAALYRLAAELRDQGAA